MKYREDVYTDCPFYIKETGSRLICEGVADDSTNTTMFSNSPSKTKHKNRYCRNKYYDCALCKALMSKYE